MCSTEVAQSILEKDFEGVLNNDGYATYNGVNPKDRQACLAHLIRNAKEIKQAEQSLRNIVIFRKVCFGTRSPEGSYSHSVLPSLLLTAKRQGQHPLNFLKTLFLQDTATSQRALYYNSS